MPSQGTIYVELDKSEFLQGDTIRGKVLILLQRPFQADKLTLELRGTERLHWEGRDDSHRSPKHPKKIYIKETLIKVGQDLKSFKDCQVREGKTEVEFKVNIPVNSLPTFYYASEQALFRIEYFLVAKLGIHSWRPSKGD